MSTHTNTSDKPIEHIFNVVLCDREVFEKLAARGREPPVWCDVCLEVLKKEDRWKCQVCPNYDMCTTCLEDVNKKEHADGTHLFERINVQD